MGSVRYRGTFIHGRPDRLRVLESMGFVFSLHENAWERFLEALHAFQSREGHCRVPRRHKEGEYNLGNAVNHVRCLGTFISGQPDRRRILEDMRFVFDEREMKWQDFLDALYIFRTREGHCRIPPKHNEG